MEVISIVNFIISKSYRKMTIREFGFEDEETLNLIIQILCFIMEKSLLEEPCTKEDISAFARTLDVELYKKQIPDEKYLELTDFIIRDCLQNGGVPYYFKTYDNEQNKLIEINIKLIDDKRIIDHDQKKFSYYMTPQGYKFLFNTLEIEESMQVSIEQFKLSIAIKKRNFGAAKNNINNLFNLSRTQIQKINYLIKQINEDIGLVGIEQYALIYKETFETLNEQAREYENLRTLIEATEKEIMEQAEMKMTDEFKEDIEHITYIKQRLNYIITEQTGLLLKQQELQKVYNDAIDNILAIGFENRINLEESLLEPIERNPEKVNALTKILRPLFAPSPNKIFNINLAFKEQRVEVESDDDENDDGVIRDERFINQGETESLKRIREMNASYRNIVNIICDSILKANGEPVRLSEIISQIKNDQETYKRFVPQLRILMNVLLKLYNAHRIEIAKMLQVKHNSIYNQSEEFDIKNTLLELIHEKEIVRNIQWIEITVDKDKTVPIEEAEESEELTSSESPFKTVERLICPQLIFKAEVKNIG